MPKGDRTGPTGLGPGTGRAFGYCYGFDSPGFIKRSGGGMGRGFGGGMSRGRGIGFGRGFCTGTFYPEYTPGYPGISPMTKDDEIKMLRSQADSLKRAQKDIEKRLNDLLKEE